MAIEIVNFPVNSMVIFPSATLNYRRVVGSLSVVKLSRIYDVLIIYIINIQKYHDV